MGANATQGLALTVFLAAFTCLGWAFFAGGSVLLMLVFVVLTAVSIGLFLKVKPLEHAER